MIEIHEVPLLHREDTVRDAVARMLEAEMPALPVVEADGRYAGVFGEREFLQALFPGYVGTLQSAGFLNRSVEDLLEKRSSCALETVGRHMNDEHVEVDEDFADLQLAEVFLHHRVLIVPVLRDKRVAGVVLRKEFFRELARRFIA